MKIFKIIALAVLLFVSADADAADRKKNKDNVAEVWYAIEIDCPSCETKLFEQMAYLKGVMDLKIDIEKQTIWIKYRTDRTDKTVLAENLKKTGYPGTEISKEEAESRVSVVHDHSHAH